MRTVYDSPVAFAVAVAVCMLVSVPSLSAQSSIGFSIDSLSGFFETSSYSDQLERTWVSSRPLQEDNEYGFTEGLFMNLHGSIYDPRFVTWNGSGMLTLKQRFLSAGKLGGKRNIHEALKDYKIAAEILKEHAVTLSLLAARNVSDVDGDFTEAINVRRSTYGSYLSWTLGRTIHVADLVRTHYLSEGLIDNEEYRNTFGYDATVRHGRLYGNIHYKRAVNEFVATGTDVTSRAASALATMNLDEAGRQRVRAALVYYDQESQNAYSRVDGSLTANLNLVRDLNTTASFSHSNDKVDSISSITNSGTIDLVHRLYSSLTTSAGWRGDYTDYDAGRQRDVTPSLRADYRKQTFFGALTLYYGFDYRRYEESFDNLTRRLVSFTAVYEQPFPIRLDDPGLDETTVEIENLSHPGQTLLENLDFLVQRTGAIIDIIIPMTSSIAGGDSLRIRYIVATDDDFAFEEMTHNFGAGLSIHRLITLRASRQTSNRSLVLGTTGSPLEDVTVDQVNLGLKHRGWQMEGFYNYRQTNINPYKRRSLTGSFMRPLLPQLNLILKTSYAVTDFTDLKERTEVVLITGSLWYRPMRHLTLEVRMVNSSRTGRRDDGHNFVFGSSGRYATRKLQVELRLNIYDREISAVGVEDRTTLHFSIKRML